MLFNTTWNHCQERGEGRNILFWEEGCPLLVRRKGRVGKSLSVFVTSFTCKWFLCLILLLLILLLLWFPHLIAVSNKFFLSQAMIFIFCAFNSQFHPTKVGRGRGRWKGVRGSLVCSLWEELNGEVPILNHNHLLVYEEPVDIQQMSNLFLLSCSKTTFMNLPYRKKKTNLNSIVLVSESNFILAFTTFCCFYNCLQCFEQPHWLWRSE